MKAEKDNYDVNIDWWHFNEQDEKMIKSMQEKKEEILLKRLKEHNLLEEIQQDSKRRFKKFMIEQHLDTKTIYYDDGSIDGKVIASFETKITMGEKGVQIEVVEKNKLSHLVGKHSKEGAAEIREQIDELREEWQRFCECEAPLVRNDGDEEYCGLCQKRFLK